MVQDTEPNAEANAKKCLVIKSQNTIDSLFYSTEKTLTDNKDKVGDNTKSDVEKAIEETKAVKGGQ
eukprot:2061431-Ditylum_brightwellii.AAC.1